MRESIDCEVCLERAAFWTSIAHYRHYRCRACGHVFIFPLPSQEELDKFYQGGAYYLKAERELERLVNEARARMRRLETFIDRYALKRQLLDVGCASGFFLREASQNGWNAIGLDRSASLAKKAEEYSGAFVLTGLLEDTHLTHGPYSVVTAWEVVEHTVDVRQFFEALTKHVAPGGLLALSTPLANGLPAKVLGKRFPMLSPPEHLRLFTRRSINVLASEFGLEEVGYHSFSNLNRRSLSSGLATLFFDCKRANVPAVSRTFLDMTSAALAWIPAMVDWIGRGTEMEILFRRKAPRHDNVECVRSS